MIEDPRGRIDYEENGDGPTVVLVPGSCATGAAWRPVIAAWNGAFRVVTTSLLGYGGTAERRTAADASMDHEADVVEAVIARAGGKVHLVGHSYGAAASLALALRDKSALASLTLVEMPTPQVLRAVGADEHYQAFRRMTDVYRADFAAGRPDAIVAMIDFYGGEGTFESWPRRVRDYAMRTTPVNLLDWVTAYGYELTVGMLQALRLPALVLYGQLSPPAMQVGAAALARGLDAPLEILDGAAHFMIVTHAEEVARRIAARVHRAEGM